MLVYRISKKDYSAIDGAGGLFYPGRWHKAGYRVVYAAQCRSLAALEYLVHLSSAHFLKNNFVVSTIFIPDEEPVKIVSGKILVEEWMALHNISLTQKIGTLFLEKAEALLLKVPSAIIPEEFNYIINPSHPSFKVCKVLDIQTFKFDGRLPKA